MNTNYGLRVPDDAEIRRAFGSLAACVRVTGGDLPTILFYLANQERIENAAPVDRASGDFADAIHERALIEEAAATWDSAAKPTIRLVADELSVCRSVARRALVAGGRWTR